MIRAEATYRIRSSFLVPLGLDVLLLFALLALSLAYQGSGAERAFLAFLSIVSLLFLTEAWNRKIVTSAGGIALKKFLKLRELFWSDITHVGCLKVRSRVYILLTTKKGFHIISNAYDSFATLTAVIIRHLDTEKIEVEAEVREQMEKPIRNISDLVAVWMAAAVLSVIIYMKFIM